MPMGAGPAALTRASLEAQQEAGALGDSEPTLAGERVTEE